MSTSSRPLRLPGRHPVRRRALAAIAMLAVPLALAAGNVAFGANHVTAGAVAVAEAQYLGEVDGPAPRATLADGIRAEGITSRFSAGQAPAVAGQPAGTPRFTTYVWTAGWQAQIDACNGAVDLTGRYGVRVIGEHWGCGGSRFPSSGLITLSGVLSGTYRVGGVAAVLNANTQGTGNIPRGYDLLYQTCINGSNKTMSFTVLTRVG
ncbi:hypothetical protein SAMN05216282_10666 [Cryobacterium psychrotolerans]|uniref:Uncharacterized protein n=1 Tax=Cryobacterium psychrotolerans TaxID=386301 RepID=A0A1G9BXL5_9MICO|nr:MULTISPECIES: hypothetical protein [Cryobacterium]TFD42920.1 hypothetical protein E3T33_11280 [Cryobacterium sp. TMT1-2-1]TFD84122.1 hypothetical protein E3T56_10435 [Cryobacterium psychrotolerans]SDK44208.1 hypothetical protein SAMN05216282_10666 [Cryobacterium psychrotolerans]